MFGCRSEAMMRASRCKFALTYSSLIFLVSMIFIATYERTHALAVQTAFHFSPCTFAIHHAFTIPFQAENSPFPQIFFHHNLLAPSGLPLQTLFTGSDLFCSTVFFAF